MARRLQVGILTMAGTVFAFTLLAPGLAGAVNCKFVLKNLSLPGRTAQDVAETMMIDVEEIEKCQEEAAAAAASKAAEHVKSEKSGD